MFSATSITSSPARHVLHAPWSVQRVLQQARCLGTASLSSGPGPLWLVITLIHRLIDGRPRRASRARPRILSTTAACRLGLVGRRGLRWPSLLRRTGGEPSGFANPKQQPRLREFPVPPPLWALVARAQRHRRLRPNRGGQFGPVGTRRCSPRWRAAQPQQPCGAMLAQLAQGSRHQCR